jgi:hypothetical protein
VRQGEIHGNRKSKIYRLPGCPGYVAKRTRNFCLTPTRHATLGRNEERTRAYLSHRQPDTYLTVIDGLSRQLRSVGSLSGTLRDTYLPVTSRETRNCRVSGKKARERQRSSKATSGSSVTRPRRNTAVGGGRECSGPPACRRVSEPVQSRRASGSRRRPGDKSLSPPGARYANSARRPAAAPRECPGAASRHTPG